MQQHILNKKKNIAEMAIVRDEGTNWYS